MDTGPRADSGYDLALTEVIEDGRHYFAVEAGSEAGERGARRGRERRRRAGRAGGIASPPSARAASQMGRELETDGLRSCSSDNLEHPALGRGLRALPDLRQLHDGLPDLLLHDASRTSPTSPGRRPSAGGEWDSCFTLDFSHVAGGSVRSSSRSRYRQWMTHKLATWSTSSAPPGCVGCGRCITWCPVAIDITEEAAAIRATDGATPGKGAAERRGSAELLAEIGPFDGLEPDHLELIAGCGSNCQPRRGKPPLPRGRPGRHLLRRPPRPGRAGDLRSRPGPGDGGDARRRAR